MQALLKCKLCGQSRDFARAHVVPEFLLRWCYDEKGRFQYATVRDNRLISVRPVQNKSEPWIDYDPNLLCQPCDNEISKWETYCSKAFYRWRKVKPRSIRFVEHETGRHEETVVFTVDYRKFKLFYLSLLWRLSASSVHFCSTISLGQAEEEIRDMLLRKDPGPQDRFPCILMNVKLGDYDLLDFVDMDYWVTDADNLTVLRLIAGGFAFEFYTRRNKFPRHAQHFFLKESGDLVLLFRDVRQFESFRSMQSNN